MKWNSKEEKKWIDIFTKKGNNWQSGKKMLY